MGVIIGKNSFNKVWAASIGKAEFVKHYSGVSGFEDVDLSAEFDKIVPPKTDKPSEAKDKK